MSSIGSVYSYGSNYLNTTSTSAQRRQRPDASEMAETLFSQLDTSGKGYIEEGDLESAISGLGSSTSDLSASDIFTQLDSDSDGKVTQDELTTTLQKLSEELNSQFDQARMREAMPPPPAESETDTGFTEEELASQLEEIGSTDPLRSTLISSIIENLDEADANQDGTVSNAEAMAYDQSNGISASVVADSSSASDSTETDTGSSSVSDARIYHQIMELMRAYGTQGMENSFLSSLDSAISTSA